MTPIQCKLYQYYLDHLTGMCLLLLQVTRLMVIGLGFFSMYYVPYRWIFLLHLRLTLTLKLELLQNIWFHMNILGGNCNACISVVVYFQVVVHLSFFCFLNIKCIVFHVLFFQELRYWQWDWRKKIKNWDALVKAHCQLSISFSAIPAETIICHMSLFWNTLSKPWGLFYTVTIFASSQLM